MSSYNRLISVYSTQLSWIQRLWTVWECRSSTNLRPISNQAQYNIMIPRLWTAVGYRHLDRDGWGVFYPTVQPVRGAKGRASKSDPTKKATETDTPINLETPSDTTVCSGINIMKSGTDPPIKPDSEYPSWLWELLETAQKPKSYRELSPTSKVYWRRYNKQKAHERNTLQKQLGRS